MPEPVVQSQSYGKSDVRVSRIARDGDVHRFAQLSVSITLSGDFDAAYTDSDNSLVVPTDTIKNTVYVLASRHGIESVERFNFIVAEHFLNTYGHIDFVMVNGQETLRERLQFGGKEHTHAFVSKGELAMCDVMATRAETTMTAGLLGLEVLKTTGSAFSDFHTCDNTTLQEAGDRIFATNICANWPCNDPQSDWTAARQTIRAALVDAFANTFSPSVQATLYEMGKRALTVCPLIDQIDISLPNQHHLLVDLSPFGLENPNEVFMPVSEPFGNISATIAREEQPE